MKTLLSSIAVMVTESSLLMTAPPPTAAVVVLSTVTTITTATPAPVVACPADTPAAIASTSFVAVTSSLLQESVTPSSIVAVAVFL